MIIFATDRTVLTVEGRSLPAWKCALGGVILLGICLSLHVWYAERGTVSIARNFYGVLRVRQPPQRTGTDNFQILQSGEVTHGLQFLDPLRADRPTAYYHEKSGLGLALRCFPRQEGRRIGVVGLGIGTIAAYTKKGDSLRFYEINPEVERMAKGSFTYLSKCPAQVEVVLGDARLSLENEKPQQFDLLALDAFSSDAIPIHLLTKEAFEIFLRHLKPDGVIAVHLSNQHLDLVPSMESLASTFRLKTALISTKRNADEWWIFPSDWILLTTNEDFLKNELIRGAMAQKKDLARMPVWTDDYASLLHALRPLPLK
jgi:spermidine synthase